MQAEYTIRLHEPHAKQEAFIRSAAKRKSIRAGRRGGKTDGAAILAVERFLDSRRVLYATPTQDQIQAFWFAVTSALAEPIEAGVFVKNETMHTVELPGTKQRIRAKTAWNANTLRGDYADLLILDEWQLMAEEAWGEVGAPMLVDNNGDAVFIYTPPSLRSRAMSKAIDPQHAAKRFKLYDQRMKAGNERYAAFTFTSHENPFISEAALTEITEDMTALAYKMEIEAQDVDEAPGALWKRSLIEDNRKDKPADFDRIVVAIDPSATSTGDEAGIIGAGKVGNHFFALADKSVQGSPKTWSSAAIGLYHDLKADHIVAEANNGGEMVESVIHQIDPSVRVVLVHASRGKQTRAEPVAAIYEQGRGHHCGSFAALEDEMCLWIPGDASPNRMDALVWAATDLLLGPSRDVKSAPNPMYG